MAKRLILEILGGAFNRYWLYGLVTGFFLGQAFIIGLVIYAKLIHVPIWMP